ncbi:MAG: hypothetical protein EXQ53_10695, partial [Acidobacteria bacterium]|nr:hypothetical protein [Acidobacteriota bacterium]
MDDFRQPYALAPRRREGYETQGDQAPASTRSAGKMTMRRSYLVARLHARSEHMQRPWDVTIWLNTLAIVMLATLPVAAQNGEWRSYAGDPGSRKYAPLDQIDKSNVRNLRIAWRRPAVEPLLMSKAPTLQISNNFRATPLMVNGMLYSPNGIGLVEAFHPGTGKTIWVQEPPPGPDGLRGVSTRGLAYWRNGAEERIFVQRGEMLVALNTKTGRPYPDFGEGGGVNLRFGPDNKTVYSWSGAPQVCKDVVIVGSSMTDSPAQKDAAPGDVRAYDVRTGRLRWTFHVVPRTGETGVETWQDNSSQYTGNSNLWSLISADEDLGYAYLPLSSPTSDMYGGHRRGDNLYSD